MSEELLTAEEILAKVRREDPKAFIRGNVLYTHHLSMVRVDELLETTTLRKQGFNLYRRDST